MDQFVGHSLFCEKIITVFPKGAYFCTLHPPPEASLEEGFFRGGQADAVLRMDKTAESDEILVRKMLIQQGFIMPLGVHHLYPI
jgi:hypothetical protein